MNERPLRVAMLNRYDRQGGAAVAGFRLARALIEAGADVTLYVRDKTVEDRFVHKVGFWPSKLDLLWEKALVRWHDRKKAWNFRFGLMNRGANFAVESADVVHVHWPHHGLLSLEGLRRLPDPVVWTMHDAWAPTGGCHYPGDCEKYLVRCDACPQLRGRKNDLAARQWEKKRRLFAEKKFWFVACSNWLAVEARRSALLRDADVRVIPNPIDANVFRPGDRFAARQKFALPQEAFVVLFAAARIEDPRKGFDFLKAALAGKDCLLALMGEISDATKLPQRTAILGKISGDAALAEAYAAADVLVAPSLEDNLPNTVMEAAACGLPVVGFEVGGVPELIEDGRTGIVAPPKSVEGLSAALDRLADPEVRRRFGAAARRKVLEQFAYPVVATRYLELYREAMRAVAHSGA
ncbi:MAG: glycosyltransferase [Bacteroidia bacterium]|nr:glycosyltransferase [Bacteroidia bacterium]